MVSANMTATDLNLQIKNLILSKLKEVDIHKILLPLLGIGLGLLYFLYVRLHFEKFTKFSHIPHIERELSLPVDTAFRYGYYKRIGESSTFLEGLKEIVRDRDGSFEGSFNRFQKYSLTPEVVQAGGFHLFKRLTKWKRFAALFNKCSRDHGSILLAGEPRIRIENDISSCSLSVENILYFYFNFIWVIESFMVTLLFHFGFILSESIAVGLAACLLFVVSHPQRTAADWLFPSQVKLEWAVFLAQVYVISNLALRRTHPSWTSTVKIGMSTGILILVSQTEAQWLLISQLVIITIMQIVNLVNPYVASLVIFGHITGWQYASLVSLDTSFAHWSFYFYGFISSIITIYILKPLIDWILATRLLISKWTFVRGSFLVIAFQVIFAFIWKESNRVFGLTEDPRLSLVFHSNGFLLQKDSQVANLTSESMQRNYDESGGKLEDPTGESYNVLNISTIRQFCSVQDKLGFPVFSLLTKYGFQAVVAFYVLAVCVFLPMIKLKARRTTVAQARDKRRRASNQQYASSTYSRLNQLLALIQTQNAVIIFNLLQTIAFALFTMFLEKRWELLLTSHLCLVLSLICDQKRVMLAYRKKYSNQPGNAMWIHWAGVLLIFSIIFTMGKLRSDRMYQNSRGRFEIENQKRKHFSESLTWIKENTSEMDGKAFFAGPDILMVYVHLSTRRSCDTLRSRYDVHFMVEQGETDQGERKTKFGLTWAQMQEKIYSMFSREKSISEYYKNLIPVNVTHLLLSRDGCFTSTPSLEHSTSKSLVEPSMLNLYDFFWQQWGESSKWEGESENGFHRSCDITRLWDSAAGIHPRQGSPALIKDTPLQKVKKNKGKIVKEGTVSNEDRNLEPETICSRLLNERNVKPFTKVFENPDYTILALNQKEGRSRSRNTNQIRAPKG